LVGVKAGSHETVDTGLGFTWQSNTVLKGKIPVGGGTSIVESMLDPSLLPPVVGGGITNVEIFQPGVSATPEPASLTLFGIGTLGLIGYGWRRRKQAAA
jgi:hypothetical protein